MSLASLSESPSISAESPRHFACALGHQRRELPVPASTKWSRVTEDGEALREEQQEPRRAWGGEEGGGARADPARLQPLSLAVRSLGLSTAHPRTALKVCEAGASRAVTSLRACPGSARHPFIASEHPSVLRSHPSGRAPATWGQPPPGDYDQKRAESPAEPRGPGGDGDDHHADVRQGLGAASGLRSQGQPPPGWRSAGPGGRRGAVTESSGGGDSGGAGASRLLRRLLPRRRLRSETYRPRGQRPEGDATGPGAGGRTPTQLSRARYLAFSPRPPWPRSKPRFASQDLHPGRGSECGKPARVLGPRAPDFTHQLTFSSTSSSPQNRVFYNLVRPCWWALTARRTSRLSSYPRLPHRNPSQSGQITTLIIPPPSDFWFVKVVLFKRNSFKN